MFQNINGLGTADDSSKEDMIRTMINHYKIDVFSMAEVNTNWKIDGPFGRGLELEPDIKGDFVIISAGTGF